MILLQFSQALHSLSLVQDPYRSQIFHRCLKPSSVYYNFQTKKIKIGDFGLGLISEPHYQCPVSVLYHTFQEYWTHESYPIQSLLLKILQELQKLGLCNEKSDVWSMGCIIYEMCTLTKPFKELQQDESQITDWK